MNLEPLQRDAWLVSPMATMLHFGREMIPAKHISLVSSAIADAISGHGPKNVCITAAPRHAKSKLVSHFTPLWFLGNYPHKRVILVSYGDSLAESFGREIRNDIMEHADEFGFTVADDSRAVDRWSTTLGGGLLARGIQSALTGSGAHCLIIDDPYKNSEEANNPGFREFVLDLYQTTVRTRLEAGGSVIVCQTRWHSEDLVGFLKKSPDQGSWRFIDLPALWTKPYPDEIGRVSKNGEPVALWPEIFDVAALEDTRRAVGPETWASLYQQEPMDAATGGRVYYEFDPKLHVKPVYRNHDLPLCVSLDFNIDPATCIIGQVDERWGPAAILTNEKIFNVAILEEISLPNSNTRALLDELGERLRRYAIRGRTLPVQVYGDASGRQRKSSASESDWEQVRAFFREYSGSYSANYLVDKQNPGVKDSAEAVNRLLREKTLTVDPNCRQLIEDLKSNVWRRDSNGNATSQIDKSSPVRTHASDCLRYFCEKVAEPRVTWGERPGLLQ